MGDLSLYTKRLTIRDHRPEDIISHHELLSDKKVMLYLQDIMSRTLEDSQHNLDVAIGEINNPHRKFYFFRMEMKDSGEHVGEIGYTVKIFAPQGKSVEVGYFIREKFWGQGLTAEALNEVLRFAFLENGVFRVSCGCAKKNAGSESVMKKCGLIKEADLKSYQLHNNEMIDRVIYRLLKSEWRWGRGG